MVGKTAQGVRYIFFFFHSFEAEITTSCSSSRASSYSREIKLRKGYSSVDPLCVTHLVLSLTTQQRLTKNINIHTTAKTLLHPFCRILAEVALGLTLFGAATVYLLLASQMIRDLVHVFLSPLSQCAWNLILGVVLCPTTWFSTPKDFW